MLLRIQQEITLSTSSANLSDPEVKKYFTIMRIRALNLLKADWNLLSFCQNFHRPLFHPFPIKYTPPVQKRMWCRFVAFKPAQPLTPTRGVHRQWRTEGLRAPLPEKMQERGAKPSTRVIIPSSSPLSLKPYPEKYETRRRHVIACEV